MTSVLVTGYREFDLGISGNKDPRLPIIKEAIKRDLIRLIEDGADWLVFTGNLGFEYWALEVAKDLQADYDIHLATILAFEDQGSQWNEANQAKLAAFKSLDFFKACFPSYENPSQLKSYNQFLLENTDGAYLFYDPEMETKLKYLYQMMTNQGQYFIRKLNFDDLNEIAETFYDF